MLEEFMTVRVDTTLMHQIATLSNGLIDETVNPYRCMYCGATLHHGLAANMVYWQDGWMLDDVPVLWCPGAR